MTIDQRPETLPPDRPWMRRAVRLLGVMLVVVLLVRVFVFEPYGIMTGSMHPTIVEGDVLLVNKLPYTIRSLRHVPFTRINLPMIELPGLGSLRRGDVVVFDFPKEAGERRNEGEEFVKRAAAIAGDTVEVVDGRVRVNGVELPAPEGGRRPRASADRIHPLFNAGRPVVVPYAGMELRIDSVTATRWAPLIEGEGVSVRYRNRIVFLDGLPATRYRFSRDYFFALGDNSGDSHDSRQFGFVPFENLIGEVVLVYWSREPRGGVRWGRIVTVVE